MTSKVTAILQVDVNPPPDAQPIVVEEQGAGEPPVIWNFSTHSTRAYYKSNCIFPKRPTGMYRTRTCILDTYNSKYSIRIMCMYGNGYLCNNHDIKCWVYFFCADLIHVRDSILQLREYRPSSHIKIGCTNSLRSCMGTSPPHNQLILNRINTSLIYLDWNSNLKLTIFTTR